ncbi:MAG: hypothetical protein KC543_12030 [Myxococcales bacterium]|nr:hypothetical protein [Myxococcales bacterium]
MASLDASDLLALLGVWIPAGVLVAGGWVSRRWADARAAERTRVVVDKMRSAARRDA